MYECTTDQELLGAGRRCVISRQDLPARNHRRNDIMAAILQCDNKSKIRLCQSICIYLKNNTAKFHPDPI